LAWKRSHQAFKPHLKTFLNKEAEYYKDLEKSNKKKLDQELDALEKEFCNVMVICRNTFCDGDDAFQFRLRKQDKSGNWVRDKPFNKRLFELFYATLCELRLTYPDLASYTQNKQKLRGTLEKMLIAYLKPEFTRRNFSRNFSFASFFNKIQVYSPIFPPVAT
jgi:hypothetical protein